VEEITIGVIIEMNFGNIAGMGGAALTNYLSTPEGQDAVKKFLASPEGVSVLKNFAATPEGREVIMGILPTVLDGLNLPPGTEDMIKGALGALQ